MTITIALKLLDQPIVHDTPYLQFNEVNAQIFALLVPGAERNDNIRVAYRGIAFKLPTILEPGRSIGTIPKRALPGYLDRNPWAGYVWLEAESDQLDTINAICKAGRAYSDNAFFCTEGSWWAFGQSRVGGNAEATRLPDSHDLYSLNPPTGWLLTHPPTFGPIGDLTYWLAVHGNYGTESKRAANRFVQTLKISPEAFRTIDFLFHNELDDYTTARSTYHYIAFKDPTLLKRKDGHFFYFEVDGRTLTLLETVTRKQTESRSYLWFPSGWHMMPTAQGRYGGSTGGEYPYRLAAAHAAPTWLPPGAAKPNSNELVLRGRRTTATYAEVVPGKPGWWWIRGDDEDATKSIRSELRRFGCDWSKQRKQWFLKETRELPAGLKHLLGLESAPQADPPAPPLPTTTAVPPPATLTANPFRNAHQVVSVSLDGTATPSRSVFGDRASTNSGATAYARALAQHSASTTATPTPAAPLSAPKSSHAKVIPLPATETPKPPPLEIHQADALIGASANPALIRQAIEHARSLSSIRAEPPAPSHAGPLTIPQDYVGELTGAVSGDVHCYGYAVDNGICVFVNMGGPRGAVEAIRAKLTKGDIVNLTPWDAPAIELTAGEGKSSQYDDLFAPMSERKFCNLMLIHRSVTEPVYAERFTTYVMATDDAHAVRKVYEHVQALLKVPTFPAWRDYLWHAGTSAQLVRRIQSGGGLRFYAVKLDCDEWTRLLAGGLEQQIIQLPSDSLKGPEWPTSNT